MRRRFERRADSPRARQQFQDDTGGLEIEGPSGSFIPVVPKPNTFILNLCVAPPSSLSVPRLGLTLSRSHSGDILARWSNDALKSTVHRAVLPDLKPGEDPSAPTKTRRSVAYFCNVRSRSTPLAHCSDGNSTLTAFLCLRSLPPPTSNQQPNPDALISCIPGLEGPSGKAKYPPVVAGEYYAQMLEAEIGA